MRTGALSIRRGFGFVFFDGPPGGVGLPGLVEAHIVPEGYEASPTPGSNVKVEKLSPSFEMRNDKCQLGVSHLAWHPRTDSLLPLVLSATSR